MSDYRPVKRSASGNRHIWVLLHVESGNVAMINSKPVIFTNKGDAVAQGERWTKGIPTSHEAKQAAKTARRTVEAAGWDRAFVPHQAPAPAPTPPIPPPKAQPKRKAAAKPAGTSRPGRIVGGGSEATSGRGRVKGTTGQGKVKQAKGTPAKGRGGTSPRGGRA